TALALASSPAAAALSKKIVRKIANQEITKRAPSLRGPTGPVGPVGPVGPAGQAAVQIYARILANGTVVPSRSVGITDDNVSLNGTDYCFTGLPPVNGAQVTIDFFQTSSNETAAFGQQSVPGCEGLVKIFDAGSETVGGFFIILY
ncbi:MAG: hypothetical protein ACREBC_31545, partial [Pyrinomonadaceae bacterium]